MRAAVVEAPQSRPDMGGADHIVDFPLNRATQNATVDRGSKKLKELVREIGPECSDASGLLFGWKRMRLFTT